MKKPHLPKSLKARENREQLTALYELLRDCFRELSGLSEAKLWGGLVYRYDEHLFFTLTLRPRTVLVEMKLPIEEAELAMGLGFVHPHSFTRLARNGWVAASVMPGIPLSRLHELIDRSYFSRIDLLPRSRKRRGFER